MFWKKKNSEDGVIWGSSQETESIDFDSQYQFQIKAPGKWYKAFVTDVPRW